AGTAVFDTTGQGRGGTASNPVWTTGLFGNALSLEGTTSVAFGTGPAIVGSGDLTVSAWTRLAAGSTGGVILQQRDASNNGFVGQYKLSVGSGGTVGFFIYGSDSFQFSLTTSAAINDGAWHHVVAVREGTVGRIYLDGVLAASASGTVQALNSLNVFLGYDGRDSNGYYRGLIDEVRLYSRALSASEVTSLQSEPALVPVAPSWSSSTLNRAQAVVDAAYSASLAASASDANQLAGDTLAFGKVSGPAWLSVSAAGALSGTPSSSDVGTNLFTVRVTDSTARSADATLVVEVVASAPPNYWINAAGGSWAADANWFSGYPASGTGTPADFTRLSLGLHPTVTLDGPRTVGALLFGDAGSGGRSWTLGAGTGGPLTLGVATGSPVVSNSVGVTISVGMAGTQGLRKLGGGTLALGAASTYTGPTAIEAGMLDLGTAGSLAAGTPIEIGAGATLRSGAARTLANSLSGNGTLRSASGNLILTGSNTFSGTLEVTGGYLVLGSLNADNGGPHLKLNGGSLTLNGGFAGQTATLGNLSGTSASSRIDPA
ncbi:MAG: LamG-like jellyroll fold domain-containing protein, partial [Verrucomicrobiota bacterium]